MHPSSSDRGEPVPSAGFAARHERGIRQLGHDLGLSDEEVRAALGATPGRTPLCLEPEELASLESLGPDRLAHVSACRFCTDVKRVMDAAATNADSQAETFVRLATLHACEHCGQSRRNRGLELFLGHLGITDAMINDLQTQFASNVDIDEYIGTARNYLSDSKSLTVSYAKENPGKTALGLAAVALGAGLIYAALNADRES